MAENALIAALRSASNSAPGEESGVTSYEMPALGSASPLAIRKSAGLLNPVDFSKQRQQQGAREYGGYEPWYVQWLRSQSGKKGGGSPSNPLTQIAGGAAGIGGGLLASNFFGGVAPSIDFTGSAFSPSYTPSSPGDLSGYNPSEPFVPELPSDFSAPVYQPTYTPTAVGDLSGYDPSKPFITAEPIPDFSAPVYQPSFTPTEVGDLSGYNPSNPFTFDSSPVADLSAYTPAQSADFALAQVLPDLPVAPSAIGTQAAADALSGALADFGGLSAAGSADAALAASLTPFASTAAAATPGLASLSMPFAPVAPVETLLGTAMPEISMPASSGLGTLGGLGVMGGALAAFALLDSLSGNDPYNTKDTWAAFDKANGGTGFKDWNEYWASEDQKRAADPEYDAKQQQKALDEQNAKAWALSDALMKAYQQQSAPVPVAAPVVPQEPQYTDFQEPEYPYWYGDMTWGGY